MTLRFDELRARFPDVAAGYVRLYSAGGTEGFLRAESSRAEKRYTTIEEWLQDTVLFTRREGGYFTTRYTADYDPFNGYVGEAYIPEMGWVWGEGPLGVGTAAYERARQSPELEED